MVFLHYLRRVIGIIELLEHNKFTYLKLCDVLSQNNKCALVQATGTGKSYIVGKYIEEHGNRIIILVPSNSIGDAWEELLIHVDKKIDIVTYQMFSSKCDEYSDYDIVVADEMHHLGSDIWGRKFIDTYSGKTDTKIIGLTATEIRYLDNSRDMSEEIFDGIRVDGCDLKTAIQQGILPKFKYISALYCDEDDYEEFRRKADKTTDEKLRSQLKGSLEICIQNMVSIQQAINENLTDEYKKIIIFLNGVKTKEEAKEMFENIFTNSNFYDVDWRKSRKINKETLELFRKDEKRAVLFAIDMLNEGIHVKGTDCVIMFRKTISPQVYFQQLGRCLSSSSTKTPIVFDFVCNSKNIKTRNIRFEKGSIQTKFEELVKEQLVISKCYSEDFVDLLDKIFCFIRRDVLSDYEIDFIKKNYIALGGAAVAKILGRGTNTVYMYAKQAGLVEDKNPWKKEEIDFLKINYQKIGAKKCAEILGRSECSIFAFVSKNKIKSCVRYWQEEDDKFLTENYCKLTSAQIASALNRTVEAVHSRAKSLKLNKTKEIYFDYKKNEKIIEKYYPIYGTSIVDIFKMDVSKSSLRAYAKRRGLKESEEQ